MEIRALRPGDNLANFRSGDPYLDLYFSHFATRGAHLGVPFVALHSRWVVGGACVAPAFLYLQESVRPVLRLARLAVDLSARGQGVAAQLLRFVLQMAFCMELEGVVADTLSPQFFQRYGFTEFELEEGHSGVRPRPTSLFLPMKAIAGAMQR